MTYMSNIESLMQRVKLPNALLSMNDLGLIMNMKPEGSALRNLVNGPDFPKAYLFGGRSKRWKAEEVFQFMEQRRANY